MREVTLWFDFVSPFSWLGLMQARRFAERHDVRWTARPVVYAKLLEEFGLTGPAESAPKRRHMAQDVARSAALLGVRFVGPPAHPFRSLEALRAATLWTDAPDHLALVTALADAAWGGGRDLTDLDVVREIGAAHDCDADNLEQRVSDPSIKAALADATRQAIERGVFGVPTFEWNGELFWGQDRLPHLAARLSGELETSEQAEAFLARPRGVERRR